MTPMQFLKRSTPRVILVASVLSGLVATAGPAAAQEPPTLTIIKDTRPDQSQDFTFDASGPGLDADTSFTLDDDGNEGNALPSSEELVLTANPVGSDLPPYVITEDEVDGFDLSDIDCTLNGVALDLSDIDVRAGGELSGVTLRLDEDDVAVCTFINVEESDADPYDTYDDDPGDPAFQFVAPFETSTTNPAPVEVAGTTQPAVTQQPETQAPAVVLNETAQPAPADAAPVALAELPRTGSSARQATLVGGLLLITGGVASLIGRRRKAIQA